MPSIRWGTSKSDQLCHLMPLLRLKVSIIFWVITDFESISSFRYSVRDWATLISCGLT